MKEMAQRFTVVVEAHETLSRRHYLLLFLWNFLPLPAKVQGVPPVLWFSAMVHEPDDKPKICPSIHLLF